MPYKISKNTNRKDSDTCRLSVRFKNVIEYVNRTPNNAHLCDMLDNLLLPVHPDNYPEESDEGETETTAPAADGDGDKAAEDGKGVGENGKKKKKDGGEKVTGGTKTTGGKVAGGTKEEVVKTTEDGAIVTKPGPIVRTLADWNV